MGRLKQNEKVENRAKRHILNDVYILSNQSYETQQKVKTFLNH